MTETAQTKKIENILEAPIGLPQIATLTEPFGAPFKGTEGT